MRLRNRVVLATIVAASAASGQSSARLDLDANWRLQSSSQIMEGGADISSADFTPTGWYATSVPTTVLAALVANKVYPDPYVGMNLRDLPGMSYAIGKNFANLPMADNSPFHKGWWYRRSFSLPASMKGKHVALHFDGINYRAEVWLNGQQIARADSMAGTYRLFELDITGVVKPTGTNVLAVKVTAPDVTDLAMTWVDWNPAPPDKDMGIWRPVYLTANGDVALRYPHVVTRVDTSTLSRAALSISVDAHNLSDKTETGTVRGQIGTVTFQQAVTLAPRTTTVVRFDTTAFPQLRFTSPRLWWPTGMGAQPLYDLRLSFVANGVTSDSASVRFGMREITSDLNPTGGRLFRVNGRRILLRGGGWAPDMMMRATPDRQDAELRYTRDMGLNIIRLEGKHEDEHFYDLADRYGILVMPGWSCCDQWEQWKKWTPEDTVVAFQSQRDQILRLRNRASVAMWLDGSDNPPPADVESTYVAILHGYEWQNPVVSSATARRTTVTGAPGVKMNGPYDWVPPSYWMIDSTHGGAFGFNTETSPGAAVPPIESLRRMMPGGPAWPPDSTWLFHSGGGQFANLTAFSNALAARYGAPTSAADFAAKSQLQSYEGERAMFEAFSRNRYNATGIIQWMLNNAWPSMIWHLYDYYLRPGGGYFGTKKSFEPVHAMYSYDDRSIAVVNETARPVSGAKLTVRILGLDGTVLFRKDTSLSIPIDTVLRPFVLPDAPPSAPTYFVDLRITSSDGQPLSTNFYWLSAKMDDMDLAKSTWYGTPVKSYADFTALQTMAPTKVTRSVTVTRVGTTETAQVVLTNTGKTPAFFVRLQITKGVAGDEILPVLWNDNYISLLPGETRRISARYAVADLGGKAATLAVSASNVR